MKDPFGWSYPAGAENDPNAPWNQDYEEGCERNGDVYEAECGAKFPTREDRQAHWRHCKACKFEHDCDAADLLRKELKEEGGKL
jgi:hypothetical protein